MADKTCIAIGVVGVIIIAMLYGTGLVAADAPVLEEESYYGWCNGQSALVEYDGVYIDGQWVRSESIVCDGESMPWTVQGGARSGLIADSGQALRPAMGPQALPGVESVPYDQFLLNLNPVNLTIDRPFNPGDIVIFDTKEEVYKFGEMIVYPHDFVGPLPVNGERASPDWEPPPNWHPPLVIPNDFTDDVPMIDHFYDWEYFWDGRFDTDVLINDDFFFDDIIEAPSFDLDWFLDFNFPDFLWI